MAAGGGVDKKMSESNETAQGTIIAKSAAGTLLTIAAGHSSASLDKFATWFLASFGAGLALILSNLDDVLHYIPANTIVYSAYSFLFGSVLCVCQRYVAMVIGCGVLSAKDGRELGEKLQKMDVGEFIRQMTLAIPRPLRCLCRGVFAALARGDFAYTGRMFIRLALVQAILVSVEVVVLLLAIHQLVSQLKI